MQNINSPISQALHRLEDAFRTAGHHRKTTQILAWIALARFQAAGKLALNIEEIVQKGEWSVAINAGLKPEVAALMSTSLEGGSGVNAITLAILDATRRLCDELSDAPDSAWDVLPYLASQENRHLDSGNFFVEQSVIELMVDMLGNPGGAVWTPFDGSSQLAITAARKGYSVNNASIMKNDELFSHLLICIESAGPIHERITNEITRDGLGRPTTKADYVLAVPPLGLNLRSGDWAQWQSGDDKTNEIYDRSEAWAVSELLKRASKQLVILTSQSWLFSTGQERRLREQLLSGSQCAIESVTTLPAGVLSSTNTQSAITVFDQIKLRDAVRMTNLLSETRSSSLDELLAMYRENILRDEGESKQSRSVPVLEIKEAECILLPQRLLRKTALSKINSVALEEICISIRPPTPYRESDGEHVVELGIPDLRNRLWNPITNEILFEEHKSTLVRRRERQESFLEKDDILLSVKGTLGLARLISDYFSGSEIKSTAEDRIKAVVSTSCVGLRIDKNAALKGITPKYLVMYLRSPEGQEQIRSLHVGTAMPHISIQSLMRAVRIPVPDKTDLLAVMAEFDKLCSLEKKIERIQFEMNEITESRWMVKLA